MTGAFQSANAAVAVRERLAERFVDGDGVGWHEHHHGLWHGTERAFATELPRRTSWPSGCRRSTASSPSSRPARLVADVGCGHGASTILMAQAFPAVALRRDRLPRRLDRDGARARRARRASPTA